jgi:hypothetical protein
MDIIWKQRRFKKIGRRQRVLIKPEQLGHRKDGLLVRLCSPHSFLDEDDDAHGDLHGEEEAGEGRKLRCASGVLLDELGPVAPIHGIGLLVDGDGAAM